MENSRLYNIIHNPDLVDVYLSVIYARWRNKYMKFILSNSYVTGEIDFLEYLTDETIEKDDH